MNVAVISDIHGFSLALDRVLADIAAEPAIDRIVIAGDLCASGPDPKGVLDRIGTLDNASVIQGNTDRDLASRNRDTKSAQWTCDQLGKDGLAYLRGLAFSERIHAPGSEREEDDLLVVHANPFDQDRHLPPDAGPHELRELIGNTRAAVIAFGHLHVAYIKALENQTLIDVSAVGNPKDGDLRSKWGLIRWMPDAGQWDVQLRYVDYPLAETETQIRESGMPDPDGVITKLRKAS